ncbi:MAG: class I SAM-dependent methyltransferase [Liquorilactobacillus ghanensis]|uniref:class I SAM-dependent methyltransferase n=1 Tax=Liquorilactobacillus ghanensis TaxID=399370 RepID=UPI0039E97213
MKKSIDAPLVPVAFIFFGLASLFSAVKTGTVTNFIVPVIFLSLAAIYLHTSLFGKYRIISSVVNELNIKSDAQVLDLGTGHGAFLVEIAKRLQRPGKITGIDIWNKQDQANNSFESTKKVISEQHLTAVSELLTADMTKLPFANNSFDYVVASLSIHNVKPAIHNVKPAFKRQTAIHEAYRVLKAGGKLVVIDIEHVGEYQKVLTKLSAEKIVVRKTGINGMYAGLATKVLTASKPHHF